MSETRTILITGAGGFLGSQLRRHFEDRYPLRLVDLRPQGDRQIVRVDLAVWDDDWTTLFQGVDTVFHLAASPRIHATWTELLGPNIDAVANVFEAAARGGVRRVVFASSGHVMKGYNHDASQTQIAADDPPRPWQGSRFAALRGRFTIPYSATKLFGERLAQFYAQTHDLSAISVRLGRVHPPRRIVSWLRKLRDTWQQDSYLSPADFCQLMECCLDAELPDGYALVNGVSAAAAHRWDIEHTRRIVHYSPRRKVA